MANGMICTHIDTGNYSHVLRQNCLRIQSNEDSTPQLFDRDWVTLFRLTQPMRVGLWTITRGLGWFHPNAGHIMGEGLAFTTATESSLLAWRHHFITHSHRIALQTFPKRMFDYRKATYGADTRSKEYSRDSSAGAIASVVRSRW